MVGAESEAGQRCRATINDVFRSPRGKNPDNSGPQGAKNNPCDRVGQRNSAATTLFRRATPSAGNKQRPSSQRWLSSGAASQTMAHCSANVGRPLYYHSVDSDDKGKQQYLFINQISSYCCLSSADIYSLVLTPGGGRTPIHIKGTHSDTLGSGSWKTISLRLSEECITSTHRQHLPFLSVSGNCVHEFHLTWPRQRTARRTGK